MKRNENVRKLQTLLRDNAGTAEAGLSNPDGPVNQNSPGDLESSEGPSSVGAQGGRGGSRSPGGSPSSSDSRESGFFESPYTREEYYKVEDGYIRVFHHTPPRPSTYRPVVFIPGWGTIPEGFRDFFDVVNRRIECYYVETREKNSSRLDRRRALMGMDQLARDVRTVLTQSEVAGTGDFVLMGTCWGSTILAHGLARGFLSAPTVVLFDPMYRLWFPKYLLKWIVPLVPLWAWHIIRPIGKRIALGGMKEPTQRRRAEMFVDSADLWKWKHTALQVQNIDLYQEMPLIGQEVFVMNGVKDKIHDQNHYPKLAQLIPKGRFFYLPVAEHQREQLLGLASLLCAQVSSETMPPKVLGAYEKNVRPPG